MMTRAGGMHTSEIAGREFDSDDGGLCGRFENSCADPHGLSSDTSSFAGSVQKNLATYAETFGASTRDCSRYADNVSFRDKVEGFSTKPAVTYDCVVTDVCCVPQHFRVFCDKSVGISTDFPVQSGGLCQAQFCDPQRVDTDPQRLDKDPQRVDKDLQRVDKDPQRIEFLSCVATGDGDMDGVGERTVDTSSVASAIYEHMQSLSQGDAPLPLEDLVEFKVNSQTYFCCSLCGYFNNRKYHAQMHFKRIHVRCGRLMMRKRKFVSVFPDALSSPDPTVVQNVHKIGDTVCMEGVYRAQMRVTATFKMEKKRSKVLPIWPDSAPATAYCADVHEHGVPSITPRQDKQCVGLEDRATLRLAVTPVVATVYIVSEEREGGGKSVGPGQDVLPGTATATAKDTSEAYTKGRYTFRGRKLTTKSPSESSDEHMGIVDSGLCRTKKVKKTKRMGAKRTVANENTGQTQTVKNTRDSAIQHSMFGEDLHCKDPLYKGFTTHLTFGDDKVHWNIRR